MLIIHGFHIFKFAYLLEFIFNPKINTQDDFVVTRAHAQNGKKFESLNTQVPRGGQTRQCSALFQLSYCKQVPFLQSA